MQRTTDMVQAAIAANAHDFILGLPSSTTVLGQNGTALSGGERQRLCVARAFLKDAPILILDEPTSSIDSRTESVILDSLERLMLGRTTFMIAHRLSTLRSVNRILVLDQGRVVQEGTHLELVSRAGLYRTLHEMQASQRLRHYDDRESPADFHDAPASPATAPVPMAMLWATPNPIVLAPGDAAGVTDLNWTAVVAPRARSGWARRTGACSHGPSTTRARPRLEGRTTGPWVHDGMTFFLQDVSDDNPLTPEHTLAKVVVRVVGASGLGSDLPTT